MSYSCNIITMQPINFIYAKSQFTFYIYLNYSIKFYHSIIFSAFSYFTFKY